MLKRSVDILKENLHTYTKNQIQKYITLEKNS